MDPLLEIKEVQVKEHYDVVSKMMRSLHDHEHTLFDKTASWDDIEPTYMRYVMESQEECDGTFLIAYVDGAPAGFMFAYAEEPDDMRIEIYTGKELYISDGYVEPQHRRQGIYRKLNKIIDDKYTALGIKRTMRYTLYNNVRMRQFLESEGYVATRVFYEKWKE